MDGDWSTSSGRTPLVGGSRRPDIKEDLLVKRREFGLLIMRNFLFSSDDPLFRNTLFPEGKGFTETVSQSFG